MNHLNISRLMPLKGIPEYLLLSVAMLLAGTLSVVPPALAQTVDLLDPGNFAVFVPDDTDLSTNCGPTATCGTSAALPASQVGNFVVIGGTTDSDVATSTLTKQFMIPTTTDSDIVLDARITGKSTWRGTLYVIDLTKIDNITIPSLGAKSEAFIRVSLLDVTDPNSDNHFEVGNAAVADFACGPDRTAGAKFTLPLVSDPVEIEAEIGVCEEDSSDTFSFGAKVITGHTYELQMAIICQATTGFPFTLLSGCTFNPTPINFDLAQLISDELGGDLSFTIPAGISVDIGIDTIELPPEITVDLSGILSAVTDFLVPSIDDGFLMWDYMSATIDEDVPSLVRSGVSEALRLLHTPQGQREASGLVLYPDLCADGDCDWPEK